LYKYRSRGFKFHDTTPEFLAIVSYHVDHGFELDLDATYSLVCSNRFILKKRLQLLLRKIDYYNYTISKDVSSIIVNDPGYVSSPFQKKIWKCRQDLWEDKVTDFDSVETVDVYHALQKKKELKTESKKIFQYIIDTYHKKMI